MFLFPLYIDPGTGSMLFSIVIGITATVYFLVRALYMKAKIYISGGQIKNEKKNKFVIFAEDKRYWTLFRPIAEEFENRGMDLLYLTSSQDDPVFGSNYKHIRPELLGTGNRGFSRLNFISADFLLATTPGLDVYQWKRAKTVKHYCHIFHSTDESSNYEMFALDYYDSVLVTGGDFQINAIRKLEKLRNLPEKIIYTAGCPYLDEYKNKISTIPLEEDHIFTILISPSWGRNSLLYRYGEKLLDPLAKTGWRIIIRPHPQSLISEKELINRLTANYQTNPGVFWDFERENIYSILKADIMISDFSGIILDYMFLRNKPVIYVSQKMDLRPCDAHLIYNDQEEMWLFKTLKKTCVELDPGSFNELPETITRLSWNKTIETEILQAKNEAWHFMGEAAKRTADFMMETAG